MMSTGQTKALNDELDDLLVSAHTIKIKVRLLDLDHNYLDDFSDRFADGMVSVDMDAEVTRALDLTLFDPFKEVRLDPDEPGRTSVFASNMISIVFIVMNPTRTKTWNIPVFCGPIDDVSRDDVWIDIKCLGKESLSITNLWRGKTYKKNQQKTDVIRSILKVLVGETKLSIPDRKNKLPDEKKLNRASKPWLVAKALAQTMGFQLFYDGRGYAVMRKISDRPVIKFNEKWITAKPKVAYDLSTTINAVEVIGKKPKKGKKTPRAVLVAPKSHPLSPWRLGRGGVPRYLWTSVQDDGLRTKKECKDLARKLLNRGLLEGISVTYNAIPHPRLQEGDVVAVKTDRVDTKHVARKFTIPLVAGDDATHGYLKRMKPRGGARGVRAKKKHGHKGGGHK